MLISFFFGSGAPIELSRFACFRVKLRIRRTASDFFLAASSERLLVNQRRRIFLNKLSRCILFFSTRSACSTLVADEYLHKLILPFGPRSAAGCLSGH